MEDLSQILTFTRVVKAGSFSAAARQLKLTSSVVSKHVAKLERTLGVRLLNRSTRKLSLTEAGTAYYRHCARIVDEVEGSRRALAELRGVPRGLLRVTAPVPVASTLGPVLREFLKRYPGIQLELDASNRVADLAAEGFDVAIRAARRMPSRPNVVARLLRTIRVYLCAAPEYLRRGGTPRRPEDLAAHNCLTLPRNLQGDVLHFVRGGERVKVTVHGSVQTNTLEALHDLVLAGTGITALPGYLARPGIREGRLVPLLEDWDIETRANLYAVYLPTRHLPPKVRVFVDFLAERLGGAPGKPGRKPADRDSGEVPRPGKSRVPSG